MTMLRVAMPPEAVLATAGVVPLPFLALSLWWSLRPGSLDDGRGGGSLGGFGGSLDDSVANGDKADCTLPCGSVLSGSAQGHPIQGDPVQCGLVQGVPSQSGAMRRHPAREADPRNGGFPGPRLPTPRTPNVPPNQEAGRSLASRVPVLQVAVQARSPSPKLSGRCCAPACASKSSRYAPSRRREKGLDAVAAVPRPRPRIIAIAPGATNPTRSPAPQTSMQLRRHQNLVASDGGSLALAPISTVLRHREGRRELGA